MATTEADLVKEAMAQAFDELMDKAPIIIGAADGIGDSPLDRNARIMRFVDFAQTGTLDMLPQIGRQDLHDSLVRQFKEDMATALGKG